MFGLNTMDLGEKKHFRKPQSKTPIHCCLFHQLRAFQFHLISCEAWLAKQQPEVGWFTAKHCIFLINRLLGIHTYLFEYNIYIYCMYVCMYVGMYACMYVCMHGWRDGWVKGIQYNLA
jgi:hypothetical protein